jgi:hypothetical protein
MGHTHVNLAAITLHDMNLASMLMAFDGRARIGGFANDGRVKGPDATTLQHCADVAPLQGLNRNTSKPRATLVCLIWFAEYFSQAISASLRFSLYPSLLKD